MTTNEEQLDFWLKNNPQFESVLIGIVSSIDTRRTWATGKLNRCKDFKPDDFICQLLRILKDKDNPDKKLRYCSAIQLCDIDIVMPRLADSTLNILKTTLIFSLENEKEKFISEKVCQAVSLIAPALLTKSAWPELLNWLISSTWKHRELFFVRNNYEKLALLIYAQLAHNMGETLFLHLKPIALEFDLIMCFKPSQSLEVRFAALSAAINLMLIPSNCNMFKGLVPDIMNTLTETLECGEEAMAEEALKLLIELGRMKPSVFHRQPVDVVELMVKIMEEDGYEEGTRHLAIDFAIQLVEARKSDKVNLPLNFIKRLVDVLLKMFLEIDDKDTCDTSTYAFYVGHLNKLLLSLDGDSILREASGPNFQNNRIVAIKGFNEFNKIIHHRLQEDTSHSHLSLSCNTIILGRLSDV